MEETLQESAGCQGWPFLPRADFIQSSLSHSLPFRSFEPWGPMVVSTWESLNHTSLAKVISHRLTAVRVFNIFPV